MSSSPHDAAAKLEALHKEVQLEGPEVATLLELEGNGLKRLCPKCKGENKKNERARDFVTKSEAKEEADLVTWAGKRVEIPDGPAYTLSVNPKGFTCTSCGVFGDLVELVQLARRCTEHDALLFLARHDGLAGGEASVDEVLEFDQRISEDWTRVYESFIAECRPVPEKAQPVLAQWGITIEDAEEYRVRYRPRDYRRAITHLFDEFNVAKLTDAGVLREHRGPEDSSDSNWFDLSHRGTLRTYHVKGIPYLVVPYLLRGRPMYYKAQPLVSPARLQQMGAPYFVASSNRAPCPYNADALRQHDRIVVTRGELDALGIAVAGYPAIAVGSFSNFDEMWFQTLARKELIFMLSPRAQRDPRLKDVVATLRRYGVKSLDVLGLPSLDKLLANLRDRLGTPEARAAD